MCSSDLFPSHDKVLPILDFENYELVQFEDEDIIRVLKKVDKGDSFIVDEKKIVFFINFSLSNSKMREITLYEKVHDEEKQVKKQVIIFQEEAIVGESVRETYKILKELEDGIIATRLAKSKLIRIINVDITGLEDEGKIQTVVSYVRNKVGINEVQGGVGQLFLNPQQNRQSVAVFPVQGERGKVTVSEFGTDADTAAIVDVEYFRSMFMAGLVIPKKVLVGEEDVSGYLSQRNPSVANIANKIQVVLRTGFMQLLGLLVDEYIRPEVRKYYAGELVEFPKVDVAEYSVQMTHIVTPTELARFDEMSQVLQYLKDLTEQITDGSVEERFLFTKLFYEKYIKDPEMYVLLVQFEKEKKIFLPQNHPLS